MRIIHCFRSPVGGIFRHVRDLAQQHSALGHEIGIICDSTTGGVYEDRLFESIEPYLALGLTRLPIRRSIGLADLSAARTSMQEIAKLKPDILHGHGAKGGAYARMIGSRLRVSRSRVARFYSPHGGSLHFSRESPSGRLFFAIERQLERLTDRIVFVSDYERKTYELKVGTPRVEAATIYNGLSDNEFELVQPADDAADFLYIGMMRDLKGPDIFIDAFLAAERTVGRPLSAHMVGDGDDKPRYFSTIQKSGVGQRIRMHDAMPARQAFALAKTIVIPSRAESMPYIVLEAVAAGRPVIATRVGGIPEILGSDSEALVAPGSVGKLSEAMVRAVSDSSWPGQAMPAAAPFRDRFSAATMASRILSTYAETNGRGGTQARTGLEAASLS